MADLAATVARLEDNPPPARPETLTRLLFEGIAPHVPFVQRAVYANLWLTQPLVVRQLDRAPTTNAMVRTTTAVTRI